MSKLIDWLKFYFLGFFNHDLTKEGGERSFFNTLLSFVLAFLILCSGLIAGYTASFSVQYNSSDDFRAFLYSAFASENSNRINLSVEGGYLSAEIPEADRVNTLLGEGGEYSSNGYQLIVDTRSASTTYAEFNVRCEKSDGTLMEYSVYRTSSDEDKRFYTVSVELTGQVLDPSLKQSEYEDFLAEVSTVGGESYSETAATAYAELKTQFASGDITESQYINGVYEIYYNCYYSGLYNDAYGKAPTLRTYYLAPKTYESVDGYIAVLDNVCFCAFKSNSGVLIEFSGYFNKLADGVISGDSLSAEQMKTNVDEMITKSFSAASGLNFLVYLISLSRSCVVFVLAIILISLVAFLILKVRKVEECPSFVDAIKIVGSFLLWSSVLTFALTFGVSFFQPRGTVFVVAEIAFISVAAVRTLWYVVKELIIDKKQRDAKKEQQTI